MGAADAPRAQLAAFLSAVDVLPANWRIVPYSRNIDKFEVPIVMLKQESFERHPTAPRTHLVNFTLTIVTPHSDTEKAEDDLDDNVTLLLHTFDALGLQWKTAQKVLFDDQHLAYDIPVSITSQKDVTP